MMEYVLDTLCVQYETSPESPTYTQSRTPKEGKEKKKIQYSEAIDSSPTMLHQNDSPPTFPPTVDWPWRAKASDGSISDHHQDVIDEGSAPGRSISKTHGEKKFFAMDLILAQEARQGAAGAK